MSTMYGLGEVKHADMAKQRIEFAFKRKEDEEALDPDKRRLVPSKPKISEARDIHRRTIRTRVRARGEPPV